MKLVAVLSLCLAASAPALAQDSRTLSFSWEDGARWRVIDEWELELIAPDGEKIDRSGVVRSLWVWEADASGKPTLSARGGTLVRSSPRSDASAAAIGDRLAAGWSVGPQVAAPVAPPPEPEPEEDVPDLEALAEEGGTPEEAGASEPQEPEAAAPGMGKPDLVALVAGDAQAMFSNTFQGLHKRNVVMSREMFEGQPGGVERMLRVDPLGFCPDTGPGTVCVEVVLRETENAPAMGAPTKAGARREQLTWVLEPDTLRPHEARFETVVTYQDAQGEAAGLWQARAVHTLTFLPPEPPRALAP